MPSYVVDASVFVADVQPYETDHADSFALLLRISQEGWPIYMPSITQAEVGASIVRNTGRSDLAQRLMVRYQMADHIKVIPVDATLGYFAAQVAIQQRIRGCDAVYVALAQVMNATLITLDREQCERAPATVAARTPTEELAQLPPAQP
jgi:predicted nucleic acid-binding protein